MQEALFFNNKKYISAKRAGELTGYTSDYIGQLCRAGKISSQLIGKTRYVCEEEIVDYKKNFESGTKNSSVRDTKKVFSSYISRKRDVRAKILTKETLQPKKIQSENMETSVSKPEGQVLPESVVSDNIPKSVPSKSWLPEIDRSIKYIKDKSALFPSLNKSLDTRRLKYSALSVIESEVFVGRRKISSLDRWMSRLSLAIALMFLVGLISTLPLSPKRFARFLGDAREEASMVSAPARLGLADSGIGGQSMLASIFVPSDIGSLPINFYRYVNDAVYKVAKPWVDSLSPVVIVQNKIEKEKTTSGTEKKVDAPVAQARVVLASGVTRGYVDERYEELKNYLDTRFLGISSVPTVIRQYVTKQSDSIVNTLSAPITELNGVTINNSTFLGGAASFSSLVVSGVTTISDLVAERLSVGSTTPGYELSVVGSGYFDGGTVTAANLIATSSASLNDLVITGNGSGITFTGSGNHDISASSGTLRLGSNVVIGNIEALDDTIDIGTPGVRFDKIYANEVNASTIVGTLSAGNLTAETFNINSDNATADTEDSYLSFERGSAIPNALIRWNSTTKRFEFNMGGYFSNAENNAASTTLEVRAHSSQATSTFLVSGSDGSPTFSAFANAGLVGLGTSTPTNVLTVASSTASQLSLSAGAGVAQWAFRNAGGNFYLSTTTVAGTATTSIPALTISGSTGKVGIGTSTPSSNTLLDIWGSGGSLACGHLGLKDSANGNYLCMGPDSQGSYMEYGAVNSGFGFLNIFTSAGGAGATFNSNVRSANPGSVILTAGNISGGDIIFQTGASTDRMRIKNSGYVGISTTSPWAQLSVGMSSSTPAFVAGVAGSSTPALFVDSANNMGRVGINTSSPRAPLEVVNTIPGSGSPAYFSGTCSGCSLGVTVLNQTTSNNSSAGINFTSYSGGTTVATYGGIFGIRTSTSNGALAFGVNNNGAYTEAMRIISNTNIGIGTTTPNHALTVASTTGPQFALSAGTGLAQWTFRNAGENLYISTTTVAGTATTSTSALSIIGLSGNVGIGTTSPSAKLEILGSGNFSGLQVGNGTVGSLFQVNSGNAGFVGWNGSAYNSLDIRSQSGTQLFLSTGGNVGIADSNPSQKLSIAGAMNFTAVASPSANAAFYAPAANTLAFMTNTSERVRIDSAGNVGLGTTTPWGLLSVNANGLSSSAPQFVVGSSTATNFIVANNGNVGIGKVNPTQALDIGGVLTLSTASTINSIGQNLGLQVNGSTKISLTNVGGQFTGGYSMTGNFVNSGTLSTFSGILGIGTTTPSHKLTIADSAASQLTLSDQAGVAQWAFRNAGGNFYLSTTTVAGTATTSVSALSIIGSSGNVGIGIANPTQKLDILGNVNVSAGQIFFGQAVNTSSKIGLNFHTDSDPNYQIVKPAGAWTQPLQIQFLTGIKIGAGSNYGGTKFYNSSDLATEIMSVGNGDNHVRVANNLLITGNVGIGSTSPIAKLSVEGSLHLSGTSQDISWRTGEALQVGDYDGTTFTERMKIDTSGNLGIGTSNPGVNLANSARRGLTISGSSGSFSNGVLEFVTKESDASGVIVGQTIATDINSIAADKRVTLIQSLLEGTTATNRGGSIAFYTKSDGASGLSERMRIVSGGNVGIGTTTPSHKLTIADSAASQLTLSDQAGVAQWAFRNAGGNFYLSTTTVAGTATTSVSALSIIGSSGNVGIGTTSPMSPFTFVTGTVPTGGSAGAEFNISTIAGTGSSGVLISQSGNRTSGLSGTTLRVTNNGSSNSSGIAEFSSNVGSVVITNALNMGVGTTTPWARLSVNTGSLSAGIPSFVVGSSTRTDLVVDQAGNVGIGTTTPWGQLSVNPSGITGPAFVIGSSTATSFVVTNGGLVGVGTSTPTSFASLITIQATSSTPNVLTIASTTGATRIILGTNSTGNGAINLVNTSGGAAAGGINAFRLSAGSVDGLLLGGTNCSGGAGSILCPLFINGNQWMSYNYPGATPGQSGNAQVGIGKFGGGGVVGDALNLFAVDGAAVGNGVAISFAANRTTGGRTDMARIAMATTNIGNTTAASDLVFSTMNNVAIAERLRITGTGQVGIGTSTPAFQFQISTTTASATFKPQLALSDFSAATDLKHWTISSQGGNFYIASSTDAYATTTGMSALTILNNGNVGLGTTTPWKALAVNGGVALPALENDSTGYYVCLNTTTGALATSTTACGASSERFKENIQDIEYGLDEVMQLRAVTFDYQDSYIPNAPKQIGFIAEEVDPLMPELVAKNAEGQIQGLDYPKFVSVLVKAVQELNAKIDNALARLDGALTWFRDNKLFVQGDICVDDTCVTKEQFKEMILRSGVGAVQVGVDNSNDSNTSTTSTSTPATATSTPTTVETSTASSTEPVATSTTPSVEAQQGTTTSSTSSGQAATTTQSN